MMVDHVYETLERRINFSGCEILPTMEFYLHEKVVLIIHCGSGCQIAAAVVYLIIWRYMYS